MLIFFTKKTSMLVRGTNFKQNLRRLELRINLRKFEFR
jgi:hypothetical protein